MEREDRASITHGSAIIDFTHSVPLLFFKNSIGDKAYVGRHNTTTLLKKPRGRQLSQEQKNLNRQVIQKRVYVEHMIRAIKIFRIAKEEFRMRARMYEIAIGCVCELVRLRV
jgi:hypothetical protein